MSDQTNTSSSSTLIVPLSLKGSYSISDSMTAISLSPDIIAPIVKSVYSITTKKEEETNQRLNMVVNLMQAELSSIKTALCTALPMVSGYLPQTNYSAIFYNPQTEQQIIDTLTGESAEMALVKLFIKSISKDFKISNTTVNHYIDHRSDCSLPSDVSIDTLWQDIRYIFSRKEMDTLNVSSDQEENHDTQFFQEENDTGSLTFTIKTQVGVELKNVTITDNFKQFGKLYTRIYNKLLYEIKTKLGIDLNDYENTNTKLGINPLSVKERFFAVATDYINHSRKEFDSESVYGRYGYYSDYKARAEYYYRDDGVKFKVACTKEGSGDFVIVARNNDVYELQFTPHPTDEGKYEFTYVEKYHSYNYPERRFKIFVLKMIDSMETCKNTLT